MKKPLTKEQADKITEQLKSEGFSVTELLAGNILAASIVTEMQKRKVPTGIARSAFRQLAMLSDIWKETPEYKAQQEMEQSMEREPGDIDPGFPDGHII